MAAITTAQLTEKTLTGTGIFDELMSAMNVHLQKEYASNRIRGGDYANVYLGALNSVLQQSVAFLLQQEKAGHEADLVAQQVTNAQKEHEVLHAQKCKLDGEFDVLVEQVLKVQAETALLGQKRSTELAQVSATNVDVDSVIGRQKGLYAAQTDGFSRDAEQKAAKLMIDAWNVQRTTDPDVTAANNVNRLDDANIGSAVSAMLTGVGA